MVNCPLPQQESCTPVALLPLGNSSMKLSSLSPPKGRLDFDHELEIQRYGEKTGVPLVI